mmetsp:Transcript_7038/g.11839  ORF Transcript_7038/g.11839 Transcript_7038/m.11839 type:complete len:130 (-) Transcript_7038:188-577(-)
MVNAMVEAGIYKPDEKFKRIVYGDDDEKGPNEESKGHPFSGFLGSVVCLMCNLSYLKNPLVEKYWSSEEGWGHLGLILANTKLDIENPTLREWCLLFIRNITSWSEEIRSKLAKLSLQDGETLDTKHPT